MDPEVFGTLFFLAFVIICFLVVLVKDAKGKNYDFWMTWGLVNLGCMIVHLTNIICHKTTIGINELEQLRQAAETLAQMQ